MFLCKYFFILNTDGSIGSARLPNSDSSLDTLHSEPSTESTNSGTHEQTSLRTFQPNKREIYGKILQRYCGLACFKSSFILAVHLAPGSIFIQRSCIYKNLLLLDIFQKCI